MYNGWAEMFLPLQALEVRSIHITEPKMVKNTYSAERPVSNLSYKTSTFSLPFLSVLTPFVKVYSWDSTTGRLDLEVEQTSVTESKLFALQDTIIDLLAENIGWFPCFKTKEDIKMNFQYILFGSIFTIYLHGPNPEKKQTGRVWIWKDNAWQKGASSVIFKKGQQLRVALRFQGVSLIKTANGKNRFRLQHQTISIFMR
jgi:hypothetical protein